jgi:hypothetical protein
MENVVDLLELLLEPFGELILELVARLLVSALSSFGSAANETLRFLLSR